MVKNYNYCTPTSFSTLSLPCQILFGYFNYEDDATRKLSLSGALCSQLPTLIKLLKKALISIINFLENEERN